MRVVVGIRRLVQVVRLFADFTSLDVIEIQSVAIDNAVVVDESGNGTDRVCPAAETEHPDLMLRGVVIDDELVRRDDFLGEVGSRCSVEQVVQEAVAEADAVTVPCDDLAVGRNSRVDGTDILICRVEVVNRDLEELGQAVDVGLGVSLATTPSAVAKDDDSRCHWGKMVLDSCDSRTCDNITLRNWKKRTPLDHF